MVFPAPWRELKIWRNNFSRKPSLKVRRSSLSKLKQVRGSSEEVELKLLDATLESLQREVLKTKNSIDSFKEDLKTTVGRWRSSFPLKDETSSGKADLLAAYADKFEDDLYFQLSALDTFKALQESLIKEEKAKKRQLRMETEFTVTEESIRDIVKAEAQRLGSEWGAKNSRHGRSSRKDDNSSGNVNKGQRKRSSSSKGNKTHQCSQSTGRRKQHRNQSSNNNRRVSLPKNSCGKGACHGT